MRINEENEYEKEQNKQNCFWSLEITIFIRIYEENEDEK